jgi:glycosyltransferase involved in cell wall biosynthesis
VKFGYFGRLIPEKGIYTLCKLSDEKDLEDIEFHIWGEGEAFPPSFFEKFKNLKYHGTFSGLTGITNTIASIDAFLLLSIHPEGLPISLLEVMSAGLPWLATDRGGIIDIACDPASTRVVPANTDYSQFKQYIKDFAKDIKQGKVSKDVQKRLYVEKFSATALVCRWKDTLKLS